MIDDEVRKLKERIRSKQLIPRLFPQFFPFDKRGIIRISTCVIGLISWWWFIGFTDFQRCVVFESASQERLGNASYSRALSRDDCRGFVQDEGRVYTIAKVLDNYLL